MSDDFKWGTSPEGESDAAKRQAAREADFMNKLNRQIEKEFGIPAPPPAQATPPPPPKPAPAKAKESKGVNLQKDPVTRALYSGIPHDSAARREAIQAHLERQGISQELRVIRDLLERGNAQPPGVAPERRDAQSRGAAMRDPNARGRDSRGQEPPGRER